MAGASVGSKSRLLAGAGVTGGLSGCWLVHWGHGEDGVAGEGGKGGVLA